MDRPGRSVHDARRYFVSHVEGVDLLEPAVQLAVERLRNPPVAVISTARMLGAGVNTSPPKIYPVCFSFGFKNDRSNEQRFECIRGRKTKLVATNACGMRRKSTSRDFDDLRYP